MKKVYVIGDSISIHYGPFLERSLKGVMGYARKEGEAEALLNLDVPMGANGGDSSMVLAFLRASAQAKTIRTDLLLVNCGLHDIKTDPKTGRRQISIADYEKNLISIIAVAKEMEIFMAWIRTTPVAEDHHNRLNMDFHRFASDVEDYNRVADRIMEKNGIPVIDLYAFTVNLGEGLYCDHVHFKEEVREKQASYIAGWLDQWRQGE